MKADNIELCEFLYLPTTRCNCRCRHCAPQVHTGKAAEMSSRFLIEQYEKSKYLKETPVSIAGGEPFLKEDLDAFIMYLDAQKIPAVITTNGWFTDRIGRLADKLAGRTAVRFAVSIDGPQEMHDEIRRMRGSYERAVQSAVMLHERGFQTQINTVVQKDNLAHLEEFDAFFKEQGIPVVYIPEIFVGEDHFNFSTEDIRKMFQFVDYPRGRKYLLSKGKWKIRNCHAGRNSWMLDCNGDVYACWGGYYKDHAEKYRMGSLLEQDFDEIFESERKEMVCGKTVSACEGCLLPCEIERETEAFGCSVKLSYEEAAVLADDLGSRSLLDDYSVDAGEWYGTEMLHQQSFHWMRQKEAVLYVCVREKAEELILHYLNGHVPRMDGDEMTVSISVQDCGIFRAACEAGEHILHVPIPKEMELQGLVKIGLKINKQWTPAEASRESSDTRKLGIGVFSVQLA